MEKSQNIIPSYMLLLLAQLMVGICIVGAKALLSGLEPIIIMTVRFIIAFVFLMIFHLIFSKEKFRVLNQLTAKNWIHIIAQALCAGALFNFLLLYGLKETSASMAGIITSALPAIVAIFSIIFLKERLTVFTSLCIVFALIGLLIINAHSFLAGNSGRLYGDIIILISLLPEAAYYVLAKIYKNKIPVFLISALMNGINIPVFLSVAYFGHYTMPHSFTLHQISLLLSIGIASAFFYVFWFLGCKKIHGTSAGLSTAFMPIATLIIAWLFLGESITLTQMIGMLLVILSIFFNAGIRLPRFSSKKLSP